MTLPLGPSCSIRRSFLRLNYVIRPQSRSYAWSRTPGPRNRLAPRDESRPSNRFRVLKPTPTEPVYDQRYNEAQASVPLPGSYDAEIGLQRLLQNDTLIVVRQIEMMNIFMGFEQANRYALMDPMGNNVGYMAEEERGFFGTFTRQIFRTHRAFRSVIMDASGNPVLWIHRPFSWINSRIYAQRKLVDEASSDDKVIVLGEAQQEWHPWRRRYNVFTGRDGNFEQYARVDAPLLSWEFFLQNENDDNVASIRRNFAGFGRELFTDTGQYVLTFRPDPEAPSALANPEKQTLYKRLSLEERATILALSTAIDFDYFSRHSEGGGIGLPFFWLGDWGSDG